LALARRVWPSARRRSAFSGKADGGSPRRAGSRQPRFAYEFAAAHRWRSRTARSGPTGQKPLPAGLGDAPAAQPSGLQGKTVAHPPAGGQPAAIGGQAPGLRGSAPPKGVGGGSAPAASHSPHPSAIHAAPPPAPAVVRASPPPTPHAPPVVHAAPPPAPHMPAPAAMHMPSAPAAPAFRAPAAPAMRAPAAPAPHAPHCSMDHGKPVCH